jgi:hypothetical protein
LERRTKTTTARCIEGVSKAFVVPQNLNIAADHFNPVLKTQELD